MELAQLLAHCRELEDEKALAVLRGCLEGNEEVGRGLKSADFSSFSFISLHFLAISLHFDSVFVPLPPSEPASKRSLLSFEEQKAGLAALAQICDRRRRLGAQGAVVVASEAAGEVPGGGAALRGPAAAAGPLGGGLLPLGGLRSAARAAGASLFHIHIYIYRYAYIHIYIHISYIYIQHI